MHWQVLAWPLLVLVLLSRKQQLLARAKWPRAQCLDLNGHA